jgi:hypothetical protein
MVEDNIKERKMREPNLHPLSPNRTWIELLQWEVTPSEPHISNSKTSHAPGSSENICCRNKNVSHIASPLLF